MEQIPNTAMSHDFGYVLLVVSTVRSLGNPQLGTGFRVCPWYNPVEPLLVAVDPQNFRIRFQTPTGLNMPAERNLLELIFGGQPWLYVFSIKGICVVRVQPSRNASVLAPIIDVNSKLSI